MKFRDWIIKEKTVLLLYMCYPLIYQQKGAVKNKLLNTDYCNG